MDGPGSIELWELLDLLRCVSTLNLFYDKFTKNEILGKTDLSLVMQLHTTRSINLTGTILTRELGRENRFLTVILNHSGKFYESISRVCI